MTRVGCAAWAIPAAYAARYPRSRATRRSTPRPADFRLAGKGRPAIEEGVTLDVPENDTTYTAYGSLLKQVKDDPQCEKKKAYALRRSFVDHHEQTAKK